MGGGVSNKKDYTLFSHCLFFYICVIVNFNKPVKLGGRPMIYIQFKWNTRCGSSYANL